MRYKSKPHYITAWQWEGNILCYCPPWINKLIQSGLIVIVTTNNKDEYKLEVGLYLKHTKKYTQVYPMDYLYVRGDTVHHSNCDTFEESYEPIPEDYVEPEVTKDEVASWSKLPDPGEKHEISLCSDDYGDSE